MHVGAADSVTRLTASLKLSRTEACLRAEHRTLTPLVNPVL